MTNLRKITLAVVSLSIAAAVVLGSHFKSLADKHREQVQQELRGLLGDRVQFDGLDVRYFGGQDSSYASFASPTTAALPPHRLSKRANSSSASA
jgi:hypothetical protein